ncbi:Trk system potassium uptake protein TrkA [Acaryochloris thomasi RCC1774]|uniref:Trk system potassium uptake protein TrkA n=1 Tax=Acaryochloris thomasi RCC1774 TaxID=1764569 RepID=A0A2W1JGV5_9CYAN|nr:TrkA family potassium uptake protein [Acaryochloris thomasi]PZD72823.1 Trk system potassium uptake protein TrkA [Acaryochloris thomasi RCC1774]
MRLILVGSGKLIYFLARQFASKGYHLTIITHDSAEATTLSRQFKATVMVGDGSNPATLKDAEAYRADALLALTAEDQNNLAACQVAQKQYDVSRTLALVNDPDNQAIFQELGISIAFSATEIIASLIEQQLEQEDIKTVMSAAEGEVGVVEIALNEDSPAVGKTIKELEISSQAQITCIIRNQYLVSPERWTRLQVNDRLVLVSRPEHYGPFLRVLTGEGT